MPVFPVFQGNCGGNVNRDAKYHVRSSKRNLVVTIVYQTDEDERWYPTTDEHPELVRMVNDVKTSNGDAPNGSFYINEYKQVVVPVLSTGLYYLAGKYEQPLRFTFEGHTLSGEPFDLDGNPLSPGDQWVGPHPGIGYVLSPKRGMDIRYTICPRPNVEKDILLTKTIGREAAQFTIEQVRAVKGFAGGRFYVNEFCSMFAPLEEGEGLRYVYLGKLDLSAWYPEPHVA